MEPQETPHSSALRFRVLGPVQAWRGSQPLALGSPQQQAVLTSLLLQQGRPVATQDLVDGLWGDEPPQRAAATIHVYVSKLRKAVEPDRSPRAEPTRLLTQPPGYLFSIDPGDIDLFRFEEMVEVARALWGDGCAVGVNSPRRTTPGQNRCRRSSAYRSTAIATSRSTSAGYGRPLASQSFA